MRKRQWQHKHTDAGAFRSSAHGHPARAPSRQRRPDGTAYLRRPDCTTDNSAKPLERGPPSVPGIVPSAGTSMIAYCTYDGRLIAYTNSAISQQASTVSFLGEGA